MSKGILTMSKTTTPAPKASLLGLPREIRDNIYSYLLTCHVLPNCRTKRKVILPAWCLRKNEPVSLDCNGLLSLMRTNHLLHAETTSHLYHTPTYAFTLHIPTKTNEAEANISFLTSAPVNQIHRILIEADFRAPIVDDPASRSIDFLFGNWFKPSFGKCDVGMLDAISARATSLERLEIMYCRQGAGGNERRRITWNYSCPSLGVDWFCLRPYSWMDKPGPEEEVPERLEGFGIGDDEWPREKHRPMVDGIKRAVRKVVEGGEEVADALERVMDEEPGLIHTVWRKLREIEREKAFFAGTVLRLVEGLRGTLKEVAVVGTVDREWMRAVSELGVLVKAQAMDDMEEEDGGWVTFEPLFEESKESVV